jgi:hypothetical protein
MIAIATAAAEHSVAHRTADEVGFHSIGSSLLNG